MVACLLHVHAQVLQASPLFCGETCQFPVAKDNDIPPRSLVDLVHVLLSVWFLPPEIHVFGNAFNNVVQLVRARSGGASAPARAAPLIVKMVIVAASGGTARVKSAIVSGVGDRAVEHALK